MDRFSDRNKHKSEINDDKGIVIFSYMINLTCYDNGSMIFQSGSKI